jgi:pyruvate,water dikinase
VGSIRFRDFIIPATIRSTFLKLMMSLSKDLKNTNVMDLLGDLPYKTAIINQALHQLALEAGKLPQVRDILLNTDMVSIFDTLRQSDQGKKFLEKIHSFLNEHGARTMKMYLPFSNRSWLEAPATLLATIAVLLRSNKSRAESNVCHPDIRQDLANRIPGWLRPRFIATLEQFRLGHIARESTLYTIEEGFLQARRGVDEAARRLKSTGALSQLDMVVYLTLHELYDALWGKQTPAQIAELTQRRKQARPQAMNIWRGQWQATKSTSNNATLKGLSGSSGFAMGTVRVISGPPEFGKLKPGDVLVCPYTDPAWTPLFTLACAVVSDTGGPLSHAAIVAREYGIPAVLGTQNATLVLKDGEQISVDGNSGEVRAIKYT